ncbi:MAG: amidase [Parvibaculum sp.]|uniref:amidase n=1 Tax=Parvibaculum sp. TaxID=2024848 RepID=UPI003C7534B6
MGISEYASFDGLGLAALVKSGEVSPAELAEEAISRIEKHNPALNAVVTPMYEQGRAAARAPADGPFQGVPFLLKDIMGDYEGVPTQSGSRFMSGLPALRDSTLTARFKKAGVVILGKTNVPEFGLLPTTESAFYGPARNPWNTDYSTGGSSGGSAAAVAAGIVPIAHANDGGGSIRIPAACCGLVGLKPTRGRNPLGPDLGDMMGGLIHEHIVSRTVRDTAAMLDCTHGHETGDPYYAPPVERPFLDEIARKPARLRIAYSVTNLDGRKLDPECVKGVEATAKLLRDLGHEVEEAAPQLPMEMLSGAFMGLWAAGLALQIDAHAMMTGRTPNDNEMEGLTWGLYRAGKEITAVQYQMAIAQIQIMSRQVARFMESYDAWLTPTLGAPPLKLGTIDIHERDPQKAFAPIIDYVPFTALENATGQPAISLPLHWSADGLPVGMMFAGRFGEEATLLRLAAQLEEAQPWKDRHPKIWN